MIGSSRDLNMEAQIGEDNHLDTAMDDDDRHGDEEGLW
jgi:hypothetical protein